MQRRQQQPQCGQPGVLPHHRPGHRAAQYTKHGPDHRGALNAPRHSPPPPPRTTRNPADTRGTPMLNTFKVKVALRTLLCGFVLLAAVSESPAAVTVLATAPLQTSSATLVKPNIFYVLDDSGSMSWDFLPDTVGTDIKNSSLTNYATGVVPPIRNSRYNGIYYDPATTYSPPMKYDGSSYPSQTSANTSSWKAVPYDGFNGVQKAGDPPNPGNLFTDSSSGTTQDLTATGVAVYSTFVPGEYCAESARRNCQSQSAPTTAYPFAAYVRWCTDSTLTTCQASRIDTPINGVTYTYARYPYQLADAQGSTTTLTVSGSGSSTVNNIKVNGVELLTGGSTKSSKTTSTVASYIADGINAGSTGYTANSNGNVVTIVSPYSAGAITYTPIPSISGGMSISSAKFSGFVAGTIRIPGQNIQVTIQSSTTSYPYPNTTAKASTRTDCAGTTCNFAEEMTNFANWWAYYRTRMQMTKSAVTIAFATLSTNYRLGYMSIDNNTKSDFLNVSDITTGSGGQKDLWYRKFTAARPSGGTPLRGALSIAGRYYANQLTLINGQTTTDPMQYACQRNYTIASTDGYWNKGTDDDNLQIGGSSQIGDQDGTSSGLSRPYLDGNSTSNTLADVAAYYYNTDLRTTALGNNSGMLGTDVASNNIADAQQRMYTSTIGLGVSGQMQYQSNYSSATSGDYYSVAQGNLATSTSCLWQGTGTTCTWPTPVGDTQTTIDDLWHAAVNGHGTYYSAGNPAALKTGLSNFIQSVNSATSSGAALSTTSANLTQTGNYIFASTFRSGQWYGELARYSVDNATGTISPNADWSESGTAFSNAAAQTSTAPLLDQLAYTSRNILTYDPSNGGLIPFQWSSMSTAMKNFFQLAAIGASSTSPLSQMCASGTTCLDSSVQVDSTTSGTATTAGAGGINLVNYLRGDRTNEGPDSSTYYFQRTHVLGDIVDSQAAYVQAPGYAYIDSGYATFKSTNASRQGMVYVGANDGMLHAFNSSTGAESWAYIPSMVLPNLYKLADKNYASNHQFYVDGSPQVADVQFNDGWHTILVGGLAAGGRGYYALDVTNPASPSVLWEFTNDTSKAAPYIRDADLGYSYGAPVMTKLSDGTWVALVTSGYDNVTYPVSGGTGAGTGHGILWVLNAQTGAIIKKIDTGVGSSATGAAVTGCSASPCPSGLAKIAAFQGTAANNTSPRVYGGDLFGNLWRFDISALKGDGTGTASVQLLATLADSSGNRQPITSTPQLGMSGANALVFVGTGSYLSLPDVTSTQVQTLYAIKDPLTTSTATTGIYGSPRSKTCNNTSVTNCFVKQTLTDSTANVRTVASTISAATNLTAMYGWYEDMPETGERINTDLQLQLGTLVFTSNIPNNSSACNIGGVSYLNYVDYASGLTVAGASNAGGMLSYGGTTALASTPILGRSTTGKTFSWTNLSNGKQHQDPIPTRSSSQGTRRVSWRELVNGQ
ncbi:pilus assembly protein [Variovorax sp. dw_308]|uniref:pilus assembly protein n=1 Tax=Variovorax sp. dw_308 TaxID=2721546 RepID=UPI001C46DD56|nr:PilC/PilY family type IV pilus protein [Variovorax sp. dw_308]